jgi:hypothetical protein
LRADSTKEIAGQEIIAASCKLRPAGRVALVFCTSASWHRSGSAGDETGKSLAPNARPGGWAGLARFWRMSGMIPLILSFCVLSILLCALISTDRKAGEGKTAGGSGEPSAKNHLGLQPERNS